MSSDESAGGLHGSGRQETGPVRHTGPPVRDGSRVVVVFHRPDRGHCPGHDRPAAPGWRARQHGCRRHRGDACRFPLSTALPVPTTRPSRSRLERGYGAGHRHGERGFPRGRSGSAAAGDAPVNWREALLGSTTSSTASPNRLRPSTATAMAAPGKTPAPSTAERCCAWRGQAALATLVLIQWRRRSAGAAPT